MLYYPQMSELFEKLTNINKRLASYKKHNVIVACILCGKTYSEPIEIEQIKEFGECLNCETIKYMDTPLGE